MLVWELAYAILFHGKKNAQQTAELQPLAVHHRALQHRGHGEVTALPPPSPGPASRPPRRLAKQLPPPRQQRPLPSPAACRDPAAQFTHSLSPGALLQPTGVGTAPGLQTRKQTRRRQAVC